MSPSATFEHLDAARQAHIFQVALEEFAEHGFHQASANHIVARLGIAKGSLFKYFGTKQELFAWTFSRSMDLFGAALREVREATQGKDFFTRVTASLDAGLVFLQQYPEVYKLYLKMLFHETVPMRETLLAAVRQASSRYLTPLVREGRVRGDLRADLDDGLAVFVLDAVMDRFLQARVLPYVETGLAVYDQDLAQGRAAVAALMDVLRRGLGNATAP